MLTQRKYIYKYIYRLHNICRVIYINIYRFKRHVVKLSPGKSIHFQENSEKHNLFEVKIREKYIMFGYIPGELNFRLCLNPECGITTKIK